jgi:glycosyltransferase involved in cell wall biosynthesis
MTGGTLDCAVVIPTIGRPDLQGLLEALVSAPRPHEVIVVNDRPDRELRIVVPAGLPARVVAGPGRGPAAARNTGWRQASAHWVAFLDDDIQIDPQWTSELGVDLARAAASGAVGVQGQLFVPLPTSRRPTDWERQVAGLGSGQWITADMAYRRDVLEVLGGFDERFGRAFREDAEFAARVHEHGYYLMRGGRRSVHPVGDADRWVSVRRQVGNADDALLRRLHGPQWRRLGGVPPGRRGRHALITASGVVAVVAFVARWRRTAAVFALGWLAGTAEFTLRRMRPGPRTPTELATMALTSPAIPPVAVVHYLRGWLRSRGARPLPERRPPARPQEVSA